MVSLVLLVHILVCLGVIALVLLQQGKGADVGAAFGSGSSNTIFGSRGPASFLFKLTALLVLLFFITSIGLTFLQAQTAKKANQLIVPQTTSIPMNNTSAPVPFTPPVTTAPKPVQQNPA